MTHLPPARSFLRVNLRVAGRLMRFYRKLLPLFGKLRAGLWGRGTLMSSFWAGLFCIKATLPRCATGKGIHIITVNDYLSRRDAAWMGQIYHLLGLKVGVINHESSFIYDPTQV